jgi:phosphatidate cytidylyltransferase
LLKTRVISAVIGLVLLFGVVFLGKIALGFAIMLLAIIGLFEFYRAVGNLGYKPIKIIGYISSFSLFFIGLNGQFNFLSMMEIANIFTFCIFLISLISFSIIIFSNNKYNVTDIALTIFGIFYIVFLFAFLVLTINLKEGKYFIWLIFIGAFATDTFAYFTGRLIGKTKKFIPAIVPTKTLEGCFGGAIGCAIALLLYGLFINKHITEIPLIHFIIMGIICGIISQIGDWAASAIKRYAKIKDYGSIMPGHGGVLDRFDSILFSAPVIYFYLIFFVIRG